MFLQYILFPILVLGGMGLVFGLGLGYAGKVLAVKEDLRIVEIKDALPGANCGGCGFVGCGEFAVAVLNGEAKPNACPVGGNESALRIGEILGIEVATSTRASAYIKCAGTCEKAVFRYDYYGLNDCRGVHMLAGNGSKTCAYGCIGLGSCIKACMFGAISYNDGIAVIDNSKCTACTMCIITCPRKLIDLIPQENRVRITCNSTDNGKIVRQNCTVGCIGCKICEKTCKEDAVHVNNNLASIDYDKCTQCLECVNKCPTKSIAKIHLN